MTEVQVLSYESSLSAEQFKEAKKVYTNQKRINKRYPNDASKQAAAYEKVKPFDDLAEGDLEGLKALTTKLAEEFNAHKARTKKDKASTVTPEAYLATLREAKFTDKEIVEALTSYFSKKINSKKEEQIKALKDKRSEIDAEIRAIQATM